MMRILGIVLIAGIKTILCKGIALGIILLLFWIKGKKLKCNSDLWDDFFLQISPQAVQCYTIAIYLIAAGISSFISYFALLFIGYSYSLEITLLLFIGGLIITAYKWHIKGKDYLIKRYGEILKTILDKRRQEEKNK